MPQTANTNEDGNLVRRLQAAAADLPGLGALLDEADPVGKGPPAQQADGQFSLQLPGRKVRLLIQERAHGYPRDLYATVSRIRRLKGPGDETPFVPVVLAPFISPGARKLLRDEKIGYFDGTGSLFLPLPGAYYFVDRPAPRSELRRKRQLFTGRAAQVLHVLLLEPGREWHVTSLAQQAEVSPYTAHQAVTALEEHGWVERRGRGPRAVRILRQPGPLLDAWAQHHSLNQYAFRSYYRWERSPEILRQVVTAALENIAPEYALTLASGAALVAPFATTVDRMHILVPAIGPADEVVRALDLDPVEDGANVIFLLTPHHSPLLARQRIRECWVASNIQLYLDLWAWPGRGREQAQHLRSLHLPF